MSDEVTEGDDKRHIISSSLRQVNTDIDPPRPFDSTAYEEKNEEKNDECKKPITNNEQEDIRSDVAVLETEEQLVVTARERDLERGREDGLLEVVGDIVVGAVRIDGINHTTDHNNIENYNHGVVPEIVDNDAEEDQDNVPIIEATLVEQEEVYEAKPTLPWYKSRRVQSSVCIGLVILISLSIALGVQLSSQEETIAYVIETTSTPPSISLVPTSLPTLSNSPTVSSFPSSYPTTHLNTYKWKKLGQTIPGELANDESGHSVDPRW